MNIAVYIALSGPLWDKNTYIAYKMITPAPKSLHGLLQDKNEKLSQCSKKKSEKLPVSHKIFV